MTSQVTSKVKIWTIIAGFAEQSILIPYQIETKPMKGQGSCLGCFLPTLWWPRGKCLWGWMIMSVSWMVASGRSLSPSHPKCAVRSYSACDVVCSLASSRAANTLSTCVKSRIYVLGKERHHLTPSSSFFAGPLCALMLAVDVGALSHRKRWLSLPFKLVWGRIFMLV